MANNPILSISECPSTRDGRCFFDFFLQKLLIGILNRTLRGADSMVKATLMSHEVQEFFVNSEEGYGGVPDCLISRAVHSECRSPVLK